MGAIAGVSGISGLSSIFRRGFLPTDVDGLQAWFKADSMSQANASAVATWADSSGNGYDVSQADAAKQPKFYTNVKNGKPSVRGDGGDYLSRALPASMQSNDYTIFIALKWLNVSTDQSVWEMGDSAVADQTFRAPNSTDLPSLVSYRSGGADSITSADPLVLDTSYVWTMQRDSSALKLRLWKNDISANTDAAIASATADYGTSKNLFLLSRGATLDMCVADVFEIIFYNVALATADRERVRNYLNSKYAIY